MSQDEATESENITLDSTSLLGILELVRRAGTENVLQSALNRITEEAVYLFNSEGAIIAILKEDDEDFYLTTYGEVVKELSGQSESVTEPYELAGRAAAENQTYFLNDLAFLKNLRGLKNLQRGIAIPLHWPAGRLGALAIYRGPDSPEFSEAEHNLLDRLAQLLGPLLGQMRRAELLEHTVESRDDFLSVASHDLRNPLSSMRGFTQLINRIMDKAGPDQPLPRDKILNYLQRIVRQADNLNDLIEKILDFSRILNNRLELNREVAEINQVAESAVKRFQQWLEEQERDQDPARRHRLEFSSGSQELVAEVDTARLNQIMLSLIHNALKYSPEGGPVVIKLEQDHNRVCFSVTDQGVGITPDKQASVFQRWKVPGQQRETGLGVSLFNARTIAERHGGNLAYRTTPGKGTTFSLTLPLKN
jgi:signal transduction histidine kinase